MSDIGLCCSSWLPKCCCWPYLVRTAKLLVQILTTSLQPQTLSACPTHLSVFQDASISSQSKFAVEIRHHQCCCNVDRVVLTSILKYGFKKRPYEALPQPPSDLWYRETMTLRCRYLLVPWKPPVSRFGTTEPRKSETVTCQRQKRPTCQTKP